MPRLLALTLVPFLAMAQEKTRVACVGDSITYGACVVDREKNCYPAVLGGLLGGTFEVRNFGVNGATLLRKGDNPWWKQKAFTDATDFNPNVVVIKLGSNDTKPQNWKYKADFEEDYRALIRHFKDLPAKPKVYVAFPVPVLKPNFGINKEAAAEQQPILLRIAKEEGCPVIDLFSAVATKELFDNDGIHPNALGAKKIADAVAAALKEKKK